MKKNLLKILLKTGLSEGEAQIYLSLINFSKMTVTEISKVSGIKRPTCYQYLDVLLKKDFIYKIPIGKRIFYSANNPQKILKHLKKKYISFEKSLELFTKQYEKSIGKPKVTFFEGKKSIKNIYLESFQSIGDVQSIFPPSAFFQNFTTEEYNTFDKMIKNYKFKSKDLITDDEYFKLVNKIRQKNKMSNKLTKKLPKTFNSKVDVLIYNDKVALISLEDLSAIVIQNKNVKELFKNIHNILWKVSKKV